jgi:hypothetical protein
MHTEHIKAKAGDGLPSFEKNLIKYIVVWLVRVLFNWQIASYLLKRELNIIKKLLENVSEEEITKRVYIQRAFAIEDHSRDYSLGMTLEHLDITANAIMGVIHSLSHEKVFDKPVTIEGVKPHENNAHAPQKFFKTMKLYEKFIDKQPKKHSTMTKTHPWFVAFNNSDWHCFTFMHTLVHRRQIEAIIERLNDE